MSRWSRESSSREQLQFVMKRTDSADMDVEAPLHRCGLLHWRNACIKCAELWHGVTNSELLQVAICCFYYRQWPVFKACVVHWPWARLLLTGSDRGRPFCNLSFSSGSGFSVFVGRGAGREE